MEFVELRIRMEFVELRIVYWNPRKRGGVSFRTAPRSRAALAGDCRSRRASEEAAADVLTLEDSARRRSATAPNPRLANHLRRSSPASERPLGMVRRRLRRRWA